MARPEEVVQSIGIVFIIDTDRQQDVILELREKLKLVTDTVKKAYPNIRLKTSYVVYRGDTYALIPDLNPLSKAKADILVTSDLEKFAVEEVVHDILQHLEGASGNSSSSGEDGGSAADLRLLVHVADAPTRLLNGASGPEALIQRLRKEWQLQAYYIAYFTDGAREFIKEMQRDESGWRVAEQLDGFEELPVRVAQMVLDQVCLKTVDAAVTHATDAAKAAANAAALATAAEKAAEKAATSIKPDTGKNEDESDVADAADAAATLTALAADKASMAAEDARKAAAAALAAAESAKVAAMAVSPPTTAACASAAVTVTTATASAAAVAAVTTPAPTTTAIANATATAAVTSSDPSMLVLAPAASAAAATATATTTTGPAPIVFATASASASTAFATGTASAFSSSAASTSAYLNACVVASEALAKDAAKNAADAAYAAAYAQKAAAAAAADAAATAHARGPKPVGVVFVVEGTDQQRKVLEVLCTKLTVTEDAVRKEYPTADIRVGFVHFRNRKYTMLADLNPVGNDSFVKMLSSIMQEFSASEVQDVFQSVKKVLAMNWSESYLRLLVQVSDVAAAAAGRGGFASSDPACWKNLQETLHAYYFAYFKDDTCQLIKEMQPHCKKSSWLVAEQLSEPQVLPQKIAELVVGQMHKKIAADAASSASSIITMVVEFFKEKAMEAAEDGRKAAAEAQKQERVAAGAAEDANITSASAAADAAATAATKAKDAAAVAEFRLETIRAAFTVWDHMDANATSNAVAKASEAELAAKSAADAAISAADSAAKARVRVSAAIANTTHNLEAAVDAAAVAAKNAADAAEGAATALKVALTACETACKGLGSGFTDTAAAAVAQVAAAVASKAATDADMAADTAKKEAESAADAEKKADQAAAKAKVAAQAVAAAGNDEASEAAAGLANRASRSAEAAQESADTAALNASKAREAANTAIYAAQASAEIAKAACAADAAVAAAETAAIAKDAAVASSHEAEKALSDATRAVDVASAALAASSAEAAAKQAGQEASRATTASQKANKAAEEADAAATKAANAANVVAALDTDCPAVTAIASYAMYASTLIKTARRAERTAAMNARIAVKAAGSAQKFALRATTIAGDAARAKAIVTAAHAAADAAAAAKKAKAEAEAANAAAAAAAKAANTAAGASASAAAAAAHLSGVATGVSVAFAAAKAANMAALASATAAASALAASTDAGTAAAAAAEAAADAAASDNPSVAAAAAAAGTRASSSAASAFIRCRRCRKRAISAADAAAFACATAMDAALAVALAAESADQAATAAAAVAGSAAADAAIAAAFQSLEQDEAGSDTWALKPLPWTARALEDMKAKMKLASFVLLDAADEPLTARLSAVFSMPQELWPVLPPGALYCLEGFADPRVTFQYLQNRDFPPTKVRVGTYFGKWGRHLVDYVVAWLHTPRSEAAWRSGGNGHGGQPHTAPPWEPRQVVAHTTNGEYQFSSTRMRFRGPGSSHPGSTEVVEWSDAHGVDLLDTKAAHEAAPRNSDKDRDAHLVDPPRPNTWGEMARRPLIGDLRAQGGGAYVHHINYDNSGIRTSCGRRVPAGYFFTLAPNLPARPPWGPGGGSPGRPFAAGRAIDAVRLSRSFNAAQSSPRAKAAHALMQPIDGGGGDGGGDGGGGWFTVSAVSSTTEVDDAATAAATGSQTHGGGASRPSRCPSPPTTPGVMPAAAETTEQGEADGDVGDDEAGCSSEPPAAATPTAAPWGPTVVEPDLVSLVPKDGWCTYDVPFQHPINSVRAQDLGAVEAVKALGRNVRPFSGAAAVIKVAKEELRLPRAFVPGPLVIGSWSDIPRVYEEHMAAAIALMPVTELDMYGSSKLHMLIHHLQCAATLEYDRLDAKLLLLPQMARLGRKSPDIDVWLQVLVKSASYLYDTLEIADRAHWFPPSNSAWYMHGGVPKRKQLMRRSIITTTTTTAITSAGIAAARLATAGGAAPRASDTQHGGWMFPDPMKFTAYAPLSQVNVNVQPRPQLRTREVPVEAVTEAEWSAIMAVMDVTRHAELYDVWLRLKPLMTGAGSTEQQQQQRQQLGPQVAGGAAGASSCEATLRASTALAAGRQADLLINGYGEVNGRLLNYLQEHQGQQPPSNGNRFSAHPFRSGPGEPRRVPVPVPVPWVGPDFLPKSQVLNLLMVHCKLDHQTDQLDLLRRAIEAPISLGTSPAQHTRTTTAAPARSSVTATPEEEEEAEWQRIRSVAWILEVTWCHITSETYTSFLCRVLGWPSEFAESQHRSRAAQLIARALVRGHHQDTVGPKGGH